MKFDIYQTITDKMIEMLSAGQIPWQKPWDSTGAARNWVTGRAYSLLNQLLVGGAGEWATFKQIAEAGGRVKKGAKARMIVFFSFLEKEEEDRNGEKVTRSIPYLRYSQVFDVCADVEGIDPKWAKLHDTQADMTAEKIVNGYNGPKIVSTLSNSAFYNPMTDCVTVPVKEQYKHVEEYYSTLFHELAHSTGHATRLNRFDDGAAAKFGSESYSKEELIAEITSAAIMNYLGIASETSFRNSTAYVQGWLKALKDDKTMIVRAAGAADKAMKMILGENL